MELRVLASFQPAATANDQESTITVDTSHQNTNLLRSQDFYYFYGDSANYGLFKTTDIDILTDGTGNLPYSLKRCDSLMFCPSCIVQQPEGRWEWDQRKYNPSKTSFTVAVDILNQVSAQNFPPPTRPRIVVLPNSQYYPEITGIHQYLDDLQFTYPSVYANIISTIRISPDYKVRFFLDYCIGVKQSAFGGYTLASVICEPKANHFALCQNDYIKHAIKNGRMADQCGASCLQSGGVPVPNATAFDAVPLADPSKYPKEHEIWQIVEDGRIDEYIDTGYVNYDAVVDFIRNTVNESIVFRFKQAREDFINSISTRPGYVTRGQVADPLSWVGFDWKSIWPIDCHLRCSKETGICRHYRSISIKYCNPDFAKYNSSTVQMDPSKIPLALSPILATDYWELAKIPRCGKLIDPSMYCVSDKFGVASEHCPIDFIVMEQHEREFITLKAKKSGFLSWHNTGRALQYVFRNDTTLFLKYYCKPVCQGVVMQTWLLPNLQATGLDRSDIINITTLSPLAPNAEYFIPLNLTLIGGNNLVGKVLGFDFIGMTKDDIVRIDVVTASDPRTIEGCKTSLDQIFTTFVEPPVSIPIPYQENVCVFEFDPEDPKKVPGTCSCGRNNRGGKSCDSLATTGLVKGKQVCNSWGRPNYDTLDYHENLVTVDEDGVFFDKTYNIPGCVCLNVGLIIRTRVNPSSRFEHPSIYIRDKQIAKPTYTIPEDIPTTYSNFDQAQGMCSAESSIIPSFISGDEAQQMYDIAEYPSFTSMIYDSTRNLFRWGDSGGPITYICDGTTSSGCGLALTPCKASTYQAALCQASNFNNKAFGMSTVNSILTNGDLTDSYSTVSSTITVTISPTFTGETGLLVKITFVTPPTTVLVAVTAPSGPTNCPLVASPNQYACSVTTISAIQVILSPTSGVQIREIQMYDLDDLTR